MFVRVSTCRGETGEEEGTEEVEWGRNGMSIFPGVPTQSSDAGVPRRGCPQAEALSAGEANPEGAGAGTLPDHRPQGVFPGRESEQPLPRPHGFPPHLGLLIIKSDFSQSISR